jgi:CheY-like chemotaxis protein
VVVEEVLKLLRASLPTTIEIARDLDSDSTVIADPTQLHQVLMNLCTNAAHAMREKEGTLSVELGDVDLGPSFVAAHSGMAPGRYVECAVRDNGHGMTPETLERIFDPFFTTKGKEEGTGMGLSVVHGIVQECGGAITVESMPGEGTEFRLYFPAASEGESETESVRKEGTDGTERVLFVDDEDVQGELAVEGLGRFGYRVTAMTDPVAALELFQRNPHAFDLVITDMTMPKMTGDILAKRIMLERGDIPVILYTGFSERISESKAKAMGIRALAYKPMAATSMAVTIRDVLDGTEGESAVSPVSGLDS